MLSDIALVHQQCKVQHRVKLRCIIYVSKQLYFLLHWKFANCADVQVKYKHSRKSLINFSHWQLLESSLYPHCHNNLRDFAMFPNILVVQNTLWSQYIHSNRMVSTWDNTTICDSVIGNDMVPP